MDRREPTIRDLAERVRRGDETATRQLRLELQGRLEWLVRHVLRTGMTSSRLARDIQHELDRLNGDGRLCSEQRDRLVQIVAGDLCASCIEQLRAGHLSGGILETVVS